jgi:GNAT superfamily N-acetyltransferase
MPFYNIRAIEKNDLPFLWDSLYECIYVPVGANKPERDILNLPEIATYVEGWGRLGDEGFIATLGENSQAIAAAWYRLFTTSNQGYGYINDQTPELAIAVLPQYRGQGIGKMLMIQLLQKAKLSLYSEVSLSVDPNNPAVHLYQKLGFETVRISATSLVMAIDLNQKMI